MLGKHVCRGLQELVPREQLAHDVDGYAARLSNTLTVHFRTNSRVSASTRQSRAFHAALG